MLLQRFFFGSDFFKDFVKDIESKYNIKLSKPMIFTTEDKFYHIANNTCHVCDKQCINKVIDHCHKTGKCRGSSCKICNLIYKDQLFIPVFFNNGKGYDFNLLFDDI